MSGEKQDLSDGIIVLCLVLLLIFMLIWEYKFEWFVAMWYAMKSPVYNGIALIPKDVFDTVFNWTFLSDTFLQPIKTSVSNFGISLYNVSILFSNTKFEDIYKVQEYDAYLIKTYGYTLKEYINYVNSLTIKVFFPFVALTLLRISSKINKKERFKTVYSIETLGIQESTIWPQIRPVIYDYNDFLKTKDLDKGWFAMAAKPKDYMLKNNMLDSLKYEDPDDFENYGKKYYKINITTSYNVLIKNLGEKWKGLNSLTFEEKAVLSIILPKLASDQKTFRKMNDNLAIMYSSYPEKNSISYMKFFKLFFSGKPLKAFGYKKQTKIENKTRNKILKEIKDIKKATLIDIDNIINKYLSKDIVKKNKFSKNVILKNEMNPIIQNILDTHFYKKTVFAAMLKAARDTGVLASCDFIWLKKQNRDLWYTLSQMGRTSCFVECSGVWSHYLTEVKVGRKISTPMVTNAIKAMDKYMDQTHFNYKKIEDDE